MRPATCCAPGWRRPPGSRWMTPAPATKQFRDGAAWQRHLAALDIPRRPDTLDPIRLATEGAVWGDIKAHGFLPETVIVSDDAGQFAVGRHALCRVGGDVAIPAPHRPGRADFP